ncbi:MAG TPA: hypothetical protein ENK07_07775 [Bacteroidetes bacterium]|nr:hypothetical protein [Bacteroidota bacterium]
MVKTFFLKHRDAKDIVRRIHTLGILDYRFNWGVDLDEKLNALTIHVAYTGGDEPEEKEAKVMKEIEAFIKAIDVAPEEKESKK